jgi:hypothetical protein
VDAFSPSPRRKHLELWGVFGLLSFSLGLPSNLKKLKKWYFLLCYGLPLPLAIALLLIETEERGKIYIGRPWYVPDGTGEYARVRKDTFIDCPCPFSPIFGLDDQIKLK